MGSCTSCEASSIATVKVIHVDGKLEEFPNPVKVSDVLQKSPECFVCNADEMDFNEFVRAINGEKELQQGQLYFVLPLGWLNKRLQAEDMAALAVKASVGFSSSGTGQNNVMVCCRISRRVHDPLIFCEAARESSREVMADGSGCGGVIRNNTVDRGGKGLRFATNLSVIIEE